MNCLRFDLLYEYLEGGLDAPRRDEIDAHLAACPDCRAAVEERRLIHHASFGFPNVDVPADFARRVMARVAAGRSSVLGWLAAIVGSISAVFLTFLAYVLLTGQSLIGVLTSVLGTLGKGTQVTLVWLGKVAKLGAIILPILRDLGENVVKAGRQLAASAGPGFFIVTAFTLLLLMVLAGIGLGRRLFAGERS